MIKQVTVKSIKKLGEAIRDLKLDGYRILDVATTKVTRGKVTEWIVFGWK